MEDIFDTQSELQEEQTTEQTTDNVVELTDELADNHLSEMGLSDDTENPKESEQKPKEDKLNPYEKLILAEMERRAKGEDGDMPDDNLAKGLASKDKNIHSCYQYIVAQARKKASGNCAMIEDSVVYGWAHHYYIEPKEVIDAELKPRSKTDTKASAKAKTETTPKPAKPARSEKKPKKKATYNDNPLLKAVMGKGKKTATTTTTTSTTNGKDKVTQVKKGDRVFTITEFALF